MEINSSGALPATTHSSPSDKRNGWLLLPAREELQRRIMDSFFPVRVAWVKPTNA